MRPIAAVALAALLAACASRPASSPAESPSYAAAPAAAAGAHVAPPAGAPGVVMIPDGTYATTIARADAPSGMSAGLADSVSGTWTLAIAGGHFVARLNGAEVVSSDYHSIGNQQIHFPTNDTGPMACHLDGVYRASVVDHEIRYEKVRDECTGRALVLTAHPLKMQM
jgi:hypothetical protein